MKILSEPMTKPTKFNKEMIISTIESHPEGVLTTIDSDGTPSSSVVTLHMLSDYHYFFITKDTTKKRDNLEMNPNMTFMIFDPFSRTELEVKGLVEYVWDDDTQQKALRAIDRDAKKGRRYISPYVSTKEAFAIFAIHPKSMRLTTFWDGGSGPEIFQAAIDFSLTDTTTQSGLKAS